MKILYLIKKNKVILLFILAAVFGLTLSFIFSQKVNPTELFIDSMAYKAIALNIIENGHFSDPGQPEPNNFRAPIYSLWLAFIYLMLGSFSAAVPIGIIIFSFTAPLTYLIAREIFNEKIAFLSGLLVAFEPWAAFLTGTIMSEHLFMPIFMTSIYLFIRYLKLNLPMFLYLSVGLLGISAITRPNVLYLFPIFLIFAIFKNRNIKSLRSAAITVLIFFIVVFPWLLRNKVVLGTWQITSVQGFSLYVENFNYFQVYLGNFKSLDDGYVRAYEITKGYSVTSKEGSEILMKEAVEGIKNNLFSYIKISALSLPQFFIKNSYSSLGYYLGLKDFKIQSQALGFVKHGNFDELWNKIINISLGEKILLLSGAVWPIISAFFIAGAVVAFFDRQFMKIGIFFALFIVFYFDAITHLMTELARFRIQAQPFIFMFAAAGILHFANYLCQKLKKNKAPASL